MSGYRPQCEHGGCRYRSEKDARCNLHVSHACCGRHYIQCKSDHEE